jgi:hypothetical protein
VNNHPKSDAATNDPKEQRSWSELSPQITMTGPADPKGQLVRLTLKNNVPGPADPKEQRSGLADPKEQPLTNCR